MRTVAVIQARLGSRRLPGKALMKIGNRTILDWVVYRTSKITGLDEVVVATSDQPEDDRIVAHCESLGVTCCRGSAADLVARYLHAVTETNASYILRVTADCPLLDPGLNSRILDVLKASDVDYVSYRTRSVGLVQEAFTRRALIRTADSTLDRYHREHVVPWMFENLHVRLLPSRHLGRYCVDTLKDLEFLRYLYIFDSNLFELSAAQLEGTAHYVVSAG